MFFKQQRFHFVGAGGIGMSGIAEVLLNLGYEITGSDVRLSATTDRLVKLGAKISEGHQAENVDGAKAVVVSSAVKPDNPELVEARRLQIPIIPRGELLAELMRLKFGIAIAGSHGKTTTTSMTATILAHAGLDPTVVVGGKVGTMGGSNARVGRSDFLVVESDESDGSFLKLAPIVAVVTNIDREHLDHYPDLEAIRAAFLDFVNKVPFYGAAILCLDDENVQQILPDIRRRTVTYGHSAQADLRILGASCGAFASDFSLRLKDRDLGTFHLNVPGVHNVLNATAAIGVAMELEAPLDKIREGLGTFTGVDRRFQKRGEAAGVTVIDDYGHHPTEIRATLDAARLCGFNRIHALFQPHRYTRTAALMDDFARSFHAADTVMVTPIYAASEASIEGVTGEALAARIRDFGHRNAHYVDSTDQGVAALVETATAGDAVMTLGAGNIWQAGDALLARLGARIRCRKIPVSANGALQHIQLPEFGVASVVLAYQQVDQFLIRDPRFALASVEDDETSSVTLMGVRNASRERIFDVFRPEQGRSVYRLPLAERRRRLLAVEWVKDASVSRIWPNLLAVEVIERKPVAFVRLVEDTSSSRLHLIDEDGVLLPLTRNAKFKLPVVTGISRLQKEEERKTRIRRMLKLQSEVGAHIDRISEIDLADADNLKITYPMRNRGLVLYIGYNHFALRLKRFLDNYEEVQKRIPEARALDLRLEDRITAVKDETAGQHGVE